MTPITTDTPSLYFEPTAYSFIHRVDTPTHIPIEQTIELGAYGFKALRWKKEEDIQ